MITKILKLGLLSLCILTSTYGENAKGVVIDTNGYIRSWLLAGPYPSYEGVPFPKGYTDDLLTNSGGESFIQPYKGLKDKVTFKADKATLIAGIGSVNEWGFTTNRSINIVWNELYCNSESPIISLDNKFGVYKDNIAVYAACYLTSPSARQAVIKIGSDDGYKLFLNGKFIGGIFEVRGVVPDNNQHTVYLQKGINLILLKVVDLAGGHGFCLRVVDKTGKPFKNIEVSANNPGIVLADKCKNLENVNVIDREVYGAITVDGCMPVFPENRTITIGLCSKVPLKYAICRQLISPENKIIHSENDEEFLTSSAAVLKSFKFNFDMPGKYLMRIILNSSKNSKERILTKEINVLSIEKIAAELEQNRKILRHLSVRENNLEQQYNKLKKKTDNLRTDIKAQYQKIEDLYSQRTILMKDYYGKSAESINEDFHRYKVKREEICLNGDSWQFVRATNIGKSFDSRNPPDTGWKNITVPYACIEPYFRYREFPVEGKGNKYYGSTFTLPCGGNYKFNDDRTAHGVWYRTSLFIDKDNIKDRYNIFIRDIRYYARVYLNGEYCGEWKGKIGFMNIPLKGIKPGKNRLEIFVAARKLFEPKVRDREWGICGDVYLVRTPSVFVNDVWVGSRIRNLRLDTVTEIVNKNKYACDIEVVQYVVDVNNIKLKTMRHTIDIKPNQKYILKKSTPWSDPILWGIGGDYGNPHLYQLVTEVWRDGKIVDQHFTRFGFREFWIAGCHFYLNGKRIFLQGDVGHHDYKIRKFLDVHLKLMRQNNINIIRNHDGPVQAVELAEVADEQGMLVYANMYPRINSDWSKPKYNSNETKLSMPLPDWFKTYMHKENLLNYSRWTQMMKNHPSVIIYSSDNEIFTQAWDRPQLKNENERNDTLGAFYGQYVKKLDPTRTLTRDGDVGTWDWKDKFNQHPSCETANYHYPEFSGSALIKNWQTLFGQKPIIYGETLYVSYGVWDNNCGATPKQVKMKADKCRKFLQEYVRYEIPAVIGMGIGMDGFIELKADGAGPWKITPEMRNEYKKNGIIKKVPYYPFAPIKWPSLSGPGQKKEFVDISVDTYGSKAINWFDSSREAYKDNAVNKAYQECFRKMPDINTKRAPELLIKLIGEKELIQFRKVTLRPTGNLATKTFNVISDSDGSAYFVLEEPGEYAIEVAGKRIKNIFINEIPNKIVAGWTYLKIEKVSL